jgi:hypothetical protein
VQQQLTASKRELQEVQAQLHAGKQQLHQRKLAALRAFAKTFTPLLVPDAQLAQQQPGELQEAPPNAELQGAPPNAEMQGAPPNADP